MIEMDEEEYLQSTVSDEFLYMVLMLLGPEVKDKFLYADNKNGIIYNGARLITERKNPTSCPAS